MSVLFFFFSSRRRHTRCSRDWSSDVCSSDLGKVVKVDRVEWKAIPDHQTAINALLAGEIDMLESPPHDLYPVLKQDPNVTLFTANPLGNQYTFRFNTLHKPFDNPKVRQAVFYAFNQEDFLKAVVGDPAYYKVCKAFFPCGSPMAS